MIKGLFKGLVGLVVLALTLAAAAYFWVKRPMPLRAPAANPVDLSIESGTSAKAISQAVVDAGVEASPTLLYAWFRLSGQSRQMRAGNYEIAPGTSPERLLRMLVRGEESLRTVTIVEGWNWRQVRQALAKAENLKPDSRALDDAALMAQFGRPGVAPEGRFYPDTYSYAKGSSDLAVLQRALNSMDKHLQVAWQARLPGVSLKSPEEALILASIVEKETGQGADRPMISGVFKATVGKRAAQACCKCLSMARRARCNTATSLAPLA